MPKVGQPIKPTMKTPVGKPDVPRAIKSVTYMKIPEATLVGTGQAMLLAALAEQKQLTIKCIVEEFPRMLVEAGLPDKLPPWVVKLAARLDRDARDAFMWRHEGRTVGDPRGSSSWKEIKGE